MNWITAMPVYVLGNQPTLAFTDLLWRQGEHIYTTSVCYCPNLQLTHFSQQKQLHPEIIQALLAESLLAPTQTSRTMVQDQLAGQYLFMDTQTSRPMAQLESQTVPPPMVTFESIYRSNAILEDPFLQAQIPPLVVLCDHVPAFIIEGTFDIPPAIMITFGLNAAAHAINTQLRWEQVWQQAESWLAPFCEGIVLLKNMGFANLCVHSIPALNATDRRPELVLLNAVLADFCHRHQVSFLNLWPVWQTEGLGLEITPQTALKSIAFLLTQTEREPS